MSLLQNHLGKTTCGVVFAGNVANKCKCPKTIFGILAFVPKPTRKPVQFFLGAFMTMVWKGFVAICEVCICNEGFFGQCFAGFCSPGRWVNGEGGVFA